MSKVIRILLFFLLVSAFWLNLLAKPAFAATCTFSLSPNIVSLTPNYHRGIEITLTSPDLSPGEYALVLNMPNKGTSDFGDGTYKAFTQASGATYQFFPSSNDIKWLPGKYPLKLYRRGKSALKHDQPECSGDFTVPEQPAQTSCTLSIANSRQPVQVGEEIVINVSGLKPEPINLGGLGGYRFYVYHSKDNTNYNAAEGYDDSGQITLKTKDGWFGASSAGTHTFAIRQNCALGYGCYEFLQCNKLPITIMPETKPICKTTKTNYQSNEVIQVTGDFLKEGNHTYYTDIYKYPPAGVSGYATIVSVIRDSSQSKPNGHIDINLDHALNALDEGNYTVKIVDVKVDGTTTEACPTPQFHVTKFVPPPPGTIECKVDASNEEADVLFTANFGDPVDPNTTYIPVMDTGTEKAGGKPTGQTLNLNLGKFTKDLSHTVNLKGNLCTNPESERTFQTTPLSTIVFNPCQNNGDCTSAGGLVAIGCSDKSNPANPGIYTAIGCIHTNPAEFAKDLLKFVITASGGLAFLTMLLGAFQMLTSNGNPDTLKAGQDRLTSAIIGLLFVIFAVLLMQIIGVGILCIPGFGSCT